MVERIKEEVKNHLFLIKLNFYLVDDNDNSDTRGN